MPPPEVSVASDGLTLSITRWIRVVQTGLLSFWVASSCHLLGLCCCVLLLGIFRLPRCGAFDCRADVVPRVTMFRADTYVQNLSCARVQRHACDRNYSCLTNESHKITISQDRGHKLTIRAITQTLARSRSTSASIRLRAFSADPNKSGSAISVLSCPMRRTGDDAPEQQCLVPVASRGAHRLGLAPLPLCVFGRVYRQNDQTWSLRFRKGKQTIHQERGSSGDAAGSVMSVTVPSITVKWMKNGSKCDTTEMCFALFSMVAHVRLCSCMHLRLSAFFRSVCTTFEIIL